jgi:hypothetical protein
MATDLRAVSIDALRPTSLPKKAPVQRSTLDLLITAVLANAYHLPASEVIAVARFGKRLPKAPGRSIGSNQSL